MGNSVDSPRKQGEVGYKKPPVATRFGQPNGNPRHNGAWKKEDTPRFKLEQMMKLSLAEIEDLADDVDAPLFERKLANAIIDGDWKIIEGMTNQVYGYPKQSVEQVNLTPPPPLSPRKKLKLPKKPIDKSK